MTDYISKHRHIIFAPITSNLSNATENTDVVINSSDAGFTSTGLKVSSVIKIHKRITASDSIIQTIIGALPKDLYFLINEKIKMVFEL